MSVELQMNLTMSYEADSLCLDRKQTHRSWEMGFKSNSDKEHPKTLSLRPLLHTCMFVLIKIMLEKQHIPPEMLDED